MVEYLYFIVMVSEKFFYKEFAENCIRDGNSSICMFLLRCIYCIVDKNIKKEMGNYIARTYKDFTNHR